MEQTCKKMEEYVLPKEALEMKVTNSKRPMGRTRMRWEDQVKLDWDKEVRNV
jgi:hypothetical protein